MSGESSTEPGIQELIASGERRKEELVLLADGLLDEEQAATRLGVGLVGLRDQTRAGKLIVVLLNGFRGYPACQFSADGSVPGLEVALSSMPIRADWMGLEWLLTPDMALDGFSPLMALKAGQSIRWSNWRAPKARLTELGIHPRPDTSKELKEENCVLACGAAEKSFR